MKNKVAGYTGIKPSETFISIARKENFTTLYIREDK